MEILALDVVTSSINAAVLDVERAEPVGPLVRVDIPLVHPIPEAEEVAPDQLWAAVTSAARQATRGIDHVEGVGLSCMTPALVLLDESDEPLTPIRTPLDRRARTAARQVWAAVGNDFLNTSGIRPLPGGCSAVCFRQLLSENPHLIRRIQSYLHVNGWLGMRLTGEKYFDPANASCSGLFGTLTDRKWSPQWCDFFNVAPSWLPPVVYGATTIGTLRSGIAAELGLPPGLPVKLGADNTSSAMLAATMKPGDLLHVVGPTQLLATVVEKPIPDERRVTSLLGVGDGYLHQAHNPIGLVALDWLHQLCFRDQSKEEYFSRIIEEAMARETRVTLDPSHLAGDRLEIEAHRAAFRDLTLMSDRIDLLAALLQEIRRQHRRAIDALGQGEHYRRVILSGKGVGLLKHLLPEYAMSMVLTLEEGSLRGVACLFRNSLG